MKYYLLFLIHRNNQQLLNYLCVVVESGAVLVLYVFSARCEERERVEDVVRRLVSAADQLFVVEELRREVDDGLVGAVVFAQHDAAGIGLWVEVV